jgi:hypothetical protein
MPSPNTITGFYSFTPTTLIRSSQVNNNFSLFRGNLMPIDASAASFANSAYDLGSESYFWKNIHQNIGTYIAQSTPSINPSTTTVYKLYFKSDGNLYKLNYAGSETQLNGGGGGGGANSLVWYEDEEAPPLNTINRMQVYSFAYASGHALYAEYTVPDSYIIGNPIVYKGKMYSANSSNTFLLQTTATLIRNNTDVVTSTTNQRTSTNSAITASGANQDKTQQVDFDITDGTGNINGVSVSPGDTILIKLFRGSDTATGAVGFLPKQGEVTLS